MYFDDIFSQYLSGYRTSYGCLHGLSVNACELLKSYFCERKQRVKLGDKYSDWLGLSK